MGAILGGVFKKNAIAFFVAGCGINGRDFPWERIQFDIRQKWFIQTRMWLQKQDSRFFYRRRLYAEKTDICPAVHKASIFREEFMDCPS